MDRGCPGGQENPCQCPKCHLHRGQGGDIYEQFAMVPNQKTHLLVRSRTTRNLANGESLYRFVDAKPIAGTYTIELPTDNRKGQFKREANIALRFTQCEIVRPANLKRSDYPPTMALTCISVKEKGNARRPIDWKLLTTHKIENYQDALLIVQWYGARWYIEQLFDDQEIEVLEMMNATLQRRARKPQNHNDPKCTKWAAWAIGRLGGWKGYDSLWPPGVITIKRGLDRLSYLIQGINLAKDAGTRSCRRAGWYFHINQKKQNPVFGLKCPFSGFVVTLSYEVIRM